LADPADWPSYCTHSVVAYADAQSADKGPTSNDTL